MTSRTREEAMERARAKRRRKKPKDVTQPGGVVAHVTHLAADAVRSVGTALKSATTTIVGASPE